jgi:hypothetical protein
VAVLTILASLFWLDPKPAARMVAPGLESVCSRESRCQRVGVHEADRWMERIVHQRALERGLLQSWCPWHRSPEGMATRGAWGTVAAYTLHHLGPCLPPSVLDVPILGALAARRRAESEACSRHPRCVSWRGGAS